MASRYGWTKKYVEEELYWEELWEYVVMAANFAAEEKNAEFKFHFMLHADKKSKGKWKDAPLPYPNESPEEAIEGDLGGVSQLPSHIRVYRPE